ncbi:MAG TPA: STAS domain-containing protein [Tepidisphaeraceae bacterium]|jgi:anti-sigma B factor antagonist|nr:STAS domain-containing protein [Tepidisphaeraceae bacterium]
MSHDLFQVSEIGDATVVELSLPQALDSEEFDRLNEALLSLLGERPEGRWVLDLSRLSYMGSSALGLMVNLRQRVKQGGGKLVLCGISTRLMQIFQTCCLERLFTIKPTRVEALRAIGGR